jgi:hypothetical protein
VFPPVAFNIEYLLVFSSSTCCWLPALTALVVDRLRARCRRRSVLFASTDCSTARGKPWRSSSSTTSSITGSTRCSTDGLLWSQHKLHHSEEALNADDHVPPSLGSRILLRVVLIVLPMSMAFDLKPASAGRRPSSSALARVHTTRTCVCTSGRSHSCSPDRRAIASSFDRAAAPRPQPGGVLSALDQLFGT